MKSDDPRYPLLKRVCERADVARAARLDPGRGRQALGLNGAASPQAGRARVPAAARSTCASSTGRGAFYPTRPCA